MNNRSVWNYLGSGLIFVFLLGVFSFQIKHQLELPVGWFTVYSPMLIFNLVLLGIVGLGVFYNSKVACLIAAIYVPLAAAINQAMFDNVSILTLIMSIALFFVFFKSFLHTLKSNNTHPAV